MGTSGRVAGTGLFRRYGRWPRDVPPGLFEPGAYDHYLRTRRFRDGTMLALSIRQPSRRVPPSRAGWTEGAFAALELAVRDFGRFPGGWAYFDFGRDALTAPRSLPSAAPSATRSTRPGTMSSCSPIPSFGIADRAVSRLAEGPVVRYGIAKPRPSYIARHRSSGRIDHGDRPAHTGDTGMPLQSPTSPALASHILRRPMHLVFLLTLLALGVIAPPTLGAQGVTTSAINGFVTGDNGKPLEEAVVVAMHVPSGTQYRTRCRAPAARTACPTCGSAAPTRSPPR